MASQPSSAQTPVDRPRPQALEVERAVLGAMFIDNAAVSRVIEVLGDETAFYHTANRRVYAAVLALTERGLPVDEVTVAEELKRRGQFEDVGGYPYVASLGGEMATSANAEYHARIVLERAQRRRLIDASTQTIAECYDEAEAVNEVIDRAEQRVFRIAEGEIGQGVVSLQSRLHETLELIEKAQREPDALSGVTTGYLDLNDITTGLQPSDLIIVASRPSMGKTALTLCMARNAALGVLAREKTPVLYFSLEMSMQQLAYRLLCAEAGVSSQQLRKGQLSHEEWQTLAGQVEKLSDAPIYIDDTPGISILELRAKARRAKLEFNIGLIFVDYLQLMTSTARVDNREQEIASISRSLKALAKELELPVVACAQLSRAVEARTDKRPQLSDLRESGSIEQDADVVAFLYRPGVYGIEDDEGQPYGPGKADIIIGKQRNGPTGNVSLTFIPETLQFHDHAPNDPF
ncbi:MAG: replicative DNA helicase [Candidatus Latescibacteria bacterium]|nr:replicative DNA helicase [Candidatus Latescibacterota bacterium]